MSEQIRSAESGLLTNNDRYALWQAGDHHPDLCDCAGDDWSADGEWCGGLEDTFSAVESILADHVRRAEARGAERALREAADEVLSATHERAHDEVCATQHLSDRTSAHVALDVAADWLRARADRIADNVSADNEEQA
jgi:hypothetical protein